MKAGARHVLPVLCIGVSLWAATSFVYVATPWEYPPRWDLMGYIGVLCAHPRGSDPERVHALAYDTLRRHAPAGLVRELTGAAYHPDADWRAAVAADAEAFAQQLPFYRARPAYPALMYALSAFGLDPVSAALLIAQAAYLGLALLWYGWLSGYARARLACLLTILLMTHQPIWMLARQPTADGLSALCILGALYLLLERRAPRAALALACLSILTAPGNLLFLLLLSAALAAGRPALRATVLGGMLAGLATYLAIDHASGNYRWSVWFYHAVIERLQRPADFREDIDPSALFLVYRSWGPLHEVFQLAWWWVLAGILALYARWRTAGAADVWFRYLAIAPIGIAATWLSWPFQFPRHAGALLPWYLFIAAGLATLLHDRLRLGDAHVSATAPGRPERV